MGNSIFKKKYLKIDLLHKNYEGKDILRVDNKVITKEEIANAKKRQPNVPVGLMVKCTKCGSALYSKQLKAQYMTCDFCGSYFRMPVENRIEMLADENSFVEILEDKTAKNPIDFPDYEKKISEQQNKTGYNDAVITGKCTIEGEAVYLCIMNAEFMMASMGQVVGEKITTVFEKATEEKLPVIVYTASGGARMQEGIFSLMQMAKVSGAVARHNEAGLLYITVLTHPTTGGVTASFAMEGDIILAEPKALVGFAGPRVIEQTIRQKLPEGFQTSEFLEEHGFVDAVVERKNQREVLGEILKLHHKNQDNSMPYPVKALKQFDQMFRNMVDSIDESKVTGEGNLSTAKIKRKSSNHTLSIWEKVQMARAQERPTSLEYIEKIFDGFIEFHGDRYYGDDDAIVGGIAYFNGKPVTVIGEQKGRNTSENIKRNFGMPNPEGYRKALRLMHQAEKFGRPVICFIDTPGAYPGLGAEERGQGEAIAKNLMEMAMLKVPVISFVVGEGGSGGALALGVADRVYMLENSIYSILSPEGFASILWKDSMRAKEAAEIMKITAEDLLEYDVIDDIIYEPRGGAATDVDMVAESMAHKISEDLSKLCEIDRQTLINKRYERFRKF